jgi:hypothetical protein
MSRYSLKVARDFGAKLPSFETFEEAERYWAQVRSEHLALLESLVAITPSFSADYTPDSLKLLERWYFELYEADSFGDLGISRAVFETCMAMYLGEVAVRSANAGWVVREFPFIPGKYQMGVRKGGMTLMLWRLTDHFKVPNNKRRQSIYRQFTKLFT